MIIVCEGCGKQYKIDPEKMKDDKAKFKCKQCSHMILVTKEQAVGESLGALDEEFDSILPPPPSAAEERPSEEEVEKAVKKEKPASRSTSIGTEKRKTKGMSLRTKMILLFMVIPILVIIASSAVYLGQMKSLALLITDESMQIVKKMAEDTVQEIAKAAASECRIYLETHPELKKEDFNYDQAFKSLAVQKIGLTGFSMLYELPGDDGVWRTWAHVDPNIIGIDMQQLKDVLGTTFTGFWRIFTGVEGGELSKGYHSWQDRSGNLRERFMICIPIEGTPYVIAAITYIDEFTRAIKLVETRAEKRKRQAIQIITAILIVTIFIIGLIVFIYGYKLTARLKELTDVADRISVGDLEASIQIVSKDEIGDLADAISRMQDSIRLSIERLRRRR